MSKLRITKGKQELLKKLKGNHSCYVLITCSEPSINGDMDVEMNYEGDDVLVSYLVDSASEVLSQNFEKIRGTV